MPTNKDDVRVQCPFYLYSERLPRTSIQRITCEGLVDNSTLGLTYRLPQDFQIQLETFCCQYYDRCEVYRMLLEKYQDAA